MGFVFNFITYGGHQIDGLAAEEFATALRQDGMLALARLQRKLRLVESPYRTPQTLVGGPRSDAALMASSGRTATTKAMGKGSTQHQHLIQTEVPTSSSRSGSRCGRSTIACHALSGGAAAAHRRLGAPGAYRVGRGRTKVANVIFAPIHDRRGRSILSVRDQNTFDDSLRQKRLMTLVHLFLIHRYKVVSVHYVTPTEDNQYQTAGMKALGVFGDVHDRGRPDHRRQR